MKKYLFLSITALIVAIILLFGILSSCTDSTTASESDYIKPDIYSLELNESVTMSRDNYQYIIVTRVPGGWMYTTHLTNYEGISSIFVPYESRGD